MGKQIQRSSSNGTGSRFQNGERVFRNVRNRRGKTVIIGSDCPDLETKHIREAFSALDQSDVVLGPAVDGGYYLLGTKSHSPELFEGIPWSTDRVFGITLEKLQLSRKNVWILPKLNDVDEASDLDPYLRSGKINL